jgi:transcription initiation factor TFIIE subunit alpha
MASAMTIVKNKENKIRLTSNLVADTIRDLVGEEGVKIVNFLKNRKNISEFKIAEKTGFDIHLVRHILYKLHDANLATYHRKKDRQKGWYISYWTFQQKKIKEHLVRSKKLKFDKLQDRLEKEEQNKNAFFMCVNACTRLDFDQATELLFKCPECGTLLNQQDNTKTIDNIRDQLASLRKDLVE